MNQPGYVSMAERGELAERARRARESLSACALCPRACGVDRTAGATGYCRAGSEARIYSHMPHPGEEPPLSGTRGSGTIFLSHCTMSCCYCQNYRMSQDDGGTDRSVEELAGMMRSLADRGCHNINLVSPTQFTPHILEALALAATGGVALPVVWNTSGYECPSTLALLDGVVDVYLSDIRYASEEHAARLSDTPDYVRFSRAALIEMNRQVGALTADPEGVAARGLIVRHLVLPNGLSGTAEAMRFLANELGPETHVSLMAQYYPAHRAGEFPEIARRLTRAEWREARRALAEAGLTNGWVQEYPDGLYEVAGTEIDADGQGDA